MNDFIVLHPLKKWYIVAANRWIIVAANPRYIYVRELTTGTHHGTGLERATADAGA
jgi:hypothetical protein